AGCGGTKSKEPQKQAPKFPTKPVNLIVAYGAGGGTDVTARLLAGQLEKGLGQPVTVTNVAGGGGWNGWGQLAKASPDGYTIGYINIPNIFAGYLDPKMKRPESLESFIPIINHVTDYCLWAVKGDSKFKSLQEVIDYAKANPGKLSIAAHGAGGDDHLAIVQIEKLTGAKFKVVHNDSTSTSISQLLGGHIDLMGANVSEVTNQVKNGELRVLGAMSDKPSEFLPGVKTFKEQGVDVI
ncbi:MAG: tripartite tricarboxylate transporter substrate binding protein, partial [Desulfocucumaceae bacterium]